MAFRKSIFTFLLAASLVANALAAGPRPSRGVAGEWEWKRITQRGRFVKTFTLRVTEDQQGIRGVYSVNHWQDGVWQGEDGNQTPFVGRREKNGIRIEFDPDGTQPGYLQNVRYKAPTDGRKPSIARLHVGPDRRLVWRLIRGPGIESVPRGVTLRQVKRRTR